MSYLSTLKTAFLLFPFVAFIVTIPFILIEYHKYGSISKIRVLIIYSFILYLMAIYFFLVILPLPSRDDVIKLTSPKTQLIPFSFVIDFIKETPLIITNPRTYIKALCHSSFYTVFYNILMTIPFGMYLRYYFKVNLRRTIKYSFFLSLFFELTQLTGLYFIYPRPYRLFDVDDLLLNTLGGIIGYYWMAHFNKFLPTRDEIDKKTYENAKTVSGLRRITLFCIDITLFIIMSLFIFVISSGNKFSKYISFLVYFVIIRYFWNGKTIGSNFVNVRFEFANKKFLNLFIKAISQTTYYICIPFCLVYFVFHYLIHYPIDLNLKIILLFCIILLICFYYLINIICLIKNKKMFYDKFSHVKFINTLKQESDEYERNYN